MSKEYWQKLQDPRWQKKRLEVFQRDGFKCSDCGNKELQLEVHHEYYISGREPWEYPLSAFKTLCHPCHDQLKSGKEELRTTLDWEYYKSVEDESVEHAGEPTGFIPAIFILARNLNEPASELLAMMASAIEQGIIDHETITLWRNTIVTKRIPASSKDDL